MDLGLSGRNAVVCASSQGLGRACALELARAGCTVVVNGRDQAVLDRTAEEIRKETGATVIAVAADVATREGQDALLAAVPTVDILVNNNGGPPRRDFREIDRDAMVTGVIGNMVTPIELVQRVIDGMVERKFGRIVNITSASVKMPLTGLDLSSGARAGLIAPDEGLTINAVSGYTGGGKALIAEYDSGEAPAHFVYGLTQRHKHIPEIMVHAGLDRQPIFAPAVGNFAQGMAVQVPLFLNERRTIDGLTAALDDHYAGQRFVEVAQGSGARIVPTDLNNTNCLRITVQGDAQNGCATVVAVLDNLGKGASGAAVQNLNIMLGLDEATGLK